MSRSTVFVVDARDAIYIGEMSSPRRSTSFLRAQEIYQTHASDTTFQHFSKTLLSHHYSYSSSCLSDINDEPIENRSPEVELLLDDSETLRQPCTCLRWSVETRVRINRRTYSCVRSGRAVNPAIKFSTKNTSLAREKLVSVNTDPRGSCTARRLVTSTSSRCSSG